MLQLLADHTLLLTSLVIGVAAAIGSLRVRGISLGPAAALFVGLAVGAVDESLSGAAGLPLLRELGLVLFTYTIGLASGPRFVAGLRRGGVATVLLTAGLIVVLAGLCAGAAALLDLSPADRAGLFAGATTNTPALQAAAEAVADGDPVVAYSVAYPAAVAAMLAVVTVLLGRGLPLPARLEPPPAPPRAERLVNWTVRVTTDVGVTLEELTDQHPGIGFSRVLHDGEVTVATHQTRLAPGDAVVVLGPEPVVAAVCARLGERSDLHLPLDRSVLDFRRILVSNRRIAGVRIGDLDLVRRFGVTVSRVRRGDEDLVATEDLPIELGDRLRVVGPVDQLGAVARLLGDSERRLGEVDAAGLALGITAGLAVGAIPVPLPGGVELQLGAGGGPLVLGLALGVLSRTGPITWQLPHVANLVLRQVGLLMFLAAAGLGSGTAFAEAVTSARGLRLMAAGSVIAALFAGFVALAVTVVLRRNVVEAAGMLAGIETQPAALSFATERTDGDERITAAYALVFPAAMIAKIVVVQLLV